MAQANAMENPPKPPPNLCQPPKSTRESHQTPPLPPPIPSTPPRPMATPATTRATTEIPPATTQTLTSNPHQTSRYFRVQQIVWHLRQTTPHHWQQIHNDLIVLFFSLAATNLTAWD